MFEFKFVAVGFALINEKLVMISIKDANKRLILFLTVFICIPPEITVLIRRMFHN